MARLRRCLVGIAMLGLVQTAAAAELETGTTAPALPSPTAAPSPPSPVREYTDGDGRLCRVYARQVVIEGAPQTAYATVCREADGRWVLSR
ncbi:MAG TPA: hypothetical protein VMA53_08980 [Stellaceae bacterium]|nr:hypothetical protein [Stellaceae bacterium]